MKYRISLAENPVGVSKSPNKNLPPLSHTYGYTAKPDKYGAGDLTRSWLIHVPSPAPPQPKDFIKINKMTIKAKALSHNKHKEFLKGLDVKQQVKYTKKDKYVDLPAQSFSYGLANKPSTPIKNVINGIYANKAEEKLRKNYQEFFEDKGKVKKLVVKQTPHFRKLMERRRLLSTGDESKVYKMKMFSGVKSKVAESVQQFKTYRKALHKTMSADNIYSDKILKEKYKIEAKDKVPNPEQKANNENNQPPKENQ